MTTFPRVLRPRAAVEAIKPYVPGTPVEEVKRKLGLASVIKLASNENPLGPSPLVLEAMREAILRVGFYPESSAPDLRSALAHFWGVGAEQVITGNGSDELLRLLAEAYVDPGDRVVVGAPTFSVYRKAAEIMGANVTEVPTSGGAMDLCAMACAATSEALGQQAKMVFVCSPNNPTGGSVTATGFRRFLSKMPPDCLIVLDQAYQEYAQDDMDFRQFLRLHPGLVVTRTFSKVYGLAGIRLGYAIVGDPDLLTPLWTIKDPFAVNMVAQAAGVAALADCQHVRRSVEANEAGKRQLTGGLVSLGLKPLRSRANFVLVDTCLPAAVTYNALLSQGIIVRPCTSFGLPSCIRVTVGLHDQNERFLGAMAGVRQTSVSLDPSALGIPYSRAANNRS